MIYLTRKQRELLDYITVYVGKHDGVCPSYDEMADGIGLASKSGVHRLITSLEERGHVRRLKHRARALQLIDASDKASDILPFKTRLLASISNIAADHLYSVAAIRTWVRDAQ